LRRSAEDLSELNLLGTQDAEDKRANKEERQFALSADNDHLLALTHLASALCLTPEDLTVLAQGRESLYGFREAREAEGEALMRDNAGAETWATTDRLAQLSEAKGEAPSCPRGQGSRGLKRSKLLPVSLMLLQGPERVGFT